MNSRWLGGSGLLFGAMVMVGLNLRGSIVAVAPVLDDLRQTLEITETAAGLLTAVPVLCFAVISPGVPAVARRLGTNATVALSLALLAVAVAARPWWGFGPLLLGTVLMGAAITGGNVLLPVIARRDFAARPGPAMSAITTAMLVSASVAAILTAPLAAVVGWRAALAMWAALAVVALVIWWCVAGSDPADAAAASGRGYAATGPPPVPAAWRVPAAWELGVYFGLQSLLFYATTAWLPTLLQSGGGLDATAAGTALSLFQLLGLVGALAVPMLIRTHPRRYAVVIVLAALWLTFFTGLLAAPAAWPLWAVAGGVAQGGGLAMGLSLIAARSSGPEAARTVSAVVQTVGYCLGAAGPVAIGGIIAATGGWTVPVLTLMALSAVLGALGLRAAAPHPIR